jgi:hypothetical protein
MNPSTWRKKRTMMVYSGGLACWMACENPDATKIKMAFLITGSPIPDKE